MANKYSDPQGTRFFYGKGEWLIIVVAIGCNVDMVIFRKFLIVERGAR